MTDVRVLAEERNRIFTDVYDGKIPKRVPLNVRLTLEFAIQYAGKDLTKSQWDTPNALLEVFEKVCQNFVTDVNPVVNKRFPSVYKLLGAKNWVMGSNGFIQHPEVEGLTQEEYDEFIASPYDCIMEKVLPRLYSELNSSSATKAVVLAKAFKAYFDERNYMAMTIAKVNEKYGYSSAAGSVGSCVAPLDFLADILRGFKGISLDIRRIPDKVEAAVAAVLPLMIKMGTPAMGPDKYASTNIPLHMAPFMREKDFARLYWPTLKKLVEALAEMGQPAQLFLEQDWMRFINYLEELPENTRMRFEYADPKVVKEKLGQKHILIGFYPLALLKTGTKQQCIDKAKELIDILAPGGRYLFDFDKIPLTADSVNIENLQAVLEYVAANANY